MRYASGKQRSEKVIIDLMNKHPERVTVNGKPYDPAAKVKRVNKWAPYRNQTEWRYAQHLEFMKRGGLIRDWSYEQYRINLDTGEVVPKGKHMTKDDSWYTPDFRVVCNDGSVEWHECKGAWDEAGRQRWRLAAKKRPQETWRAVQWIKGQWVYETFGERR